MHTFNSIFSRIKTPSKITYPGSERTSRNLNSSHLNDIELELKRNLMTGLPEGWIYKQQSYRLLPLFFKRPPLNKEQTSSHSTLPVRRVPTENQRAPAERHITSNNHYFEQGKYRVGFFAPHNYHNAPLFYHGFYYTHIPNPYRHVVTDDSNPYAADLAYHQPSINHQPR